MDPAQKPSPLRNRGIVLLFICFGIFMVYLDSMIVNVALPSIRSDLHVGISSLQWVIDAYTIAFACLLLTAGNLGDSWGHKKVFIGGLLGFTLASLACAFAPSISMLLIGRVLQGITGSMMIPVSLAIIRGIYPEPAARAKAIGIWAGIGGLALAAGPVAGGLLVEHWGWQSIFWINIPLGLLSAAVLGTVLKETRTKRSQKQDVLGQILFIAGISALTYACIEGNSLGWLSWPILLALGGVLVCLILFVRWELRCKEPLIPLDFFRNRIFNVACTVNFFGFFGMYAVIFLLTLYLQNINHYSALATGIRFLPLTASIMVASFVGSTIASRIGYLRLIMLGTSLVGVGVLVLTLLKEGSGYLTYAWALALVGIGVSFIGAASTIALIDAVPPERAGAAYGVTNTFRQLSAIFAVALSGTLISQHMDTPTIEFTPALFLEGSRSSFFIAGIASLIAGICAFVLLGNRTRVLVKNDVAQ
ncbi:MFS transporter [Paenibacillus sp. MMS18-CY102]|uniref:MFS transporter n=1 Tax=Paenibacillus sp. MMS18-CY102 TaxID=2682849 RepID=UPI001366384A|nr:MFS transporter [Paenibacillus sp. MMS18-CY102]MWC30779.1 DHA2 family efflux MFS transporter permease subunit [Paenibacillus sp. MMS18-CY102]